MSSIIKLIPLAIVAQVRVMELNTTQSGDARHFMDKLVDKSIDNLFHRVQKVHTLHHADLDYTTLAKAASQPDGRTVTRPRSAILSRFWRTPSSDGRWGWDWRHRFDLPERTTTVLVMRHCFRSTAHDGIKARPGLEYFSNYSAKPWAPFPVPPMHCLDRGEQLIEAQGKWLKDHGNLSTNVAVVSDDFQRDIVTAHALLRGLDVDADANGILTIDTGPFHGVRDAAICKPLSATEKVAALQKNLEAVPKLHFDDTLMTTMLDAAGIGAAGDWTKIPCTLNGTRLVGNCNVAHRFATRFLMELGGNLVVGWGKITPKEMQKVLQSHSWYRQVVNANPKIAAREQASIAQNVLSILEAGQGGTTVLMGHDGQQNALNAILDMRWEASPWPINATLPGSMLRFDRQGDTVKATYWWPSDFSILDGAMSFSKANFFRNADINTLTLRDFKSRVKRGIVATCANPWHYSYKSGRWQRRKQHWITTPKFGLGDLSEDEEI